MSDVIYECARDGEQFDTLTEFNEHLDTHNGIEDVSDEDDILSDPSGSVGSDDTAEADLDRMVQAASVPNLATLFKRGKDAGLIKADGFEYGSKA